MDAQDIIELIEYFRNLQDNEMKFEIEELLSIPLSEVHAIRYRSPHNPLKKSIFFES